MYVLLINVTHSARFSEVDLFKKLDKFFVAVRVYILRALLIVLRTISENRNQTS